MKPSQDTANLRIAVLALQGAFIEHERALEQLGCTCFEIRKLSDLAHPFDGLVLPGGESTVQSKLLHELGLFEPLLDLIEKGLPVLATCAGLILLARDVEEDDGRVRGFGTLPVTVRRNAYGRQLGSSHRETDFADKGSIPLTLIRAPRITHVDEGVQILASIDGDPAAVRCGNQFAMTFHPELDEDLTVHRFFVDIVANR